MKLTKYALLLLFTAGAQPQTFSLLTVPAYAQASGNRYKTVYFACMYPSMNGGALFQDNKTPASLSVLERDISGGRGILAMPMPSISGVVRQWQSHLMDMGSSEAVASGSRCFAFNTAETKDYFAERSFEAGGYENWIPVNRSWSDANLLYLGIEVVDKSAEAEGAKDSQARRDLGKDESYGYCIWQYTSVVNPKKSKALISGVFTYKDFSLTTVNDAWSNHVLANYDVTGNGLVCFDAGKTSYEEAVSIRDREQAQLKSIYKTVIATGWLWRGSTRPSVRATSTTASRPRASTRGKAVQKPLPKRR